MTKISLLLRSRSFWVLIAMFVITGTNALIPFMPAELQLLVQAVLTALLAYLKISPSQNYNG